MKGHLDIIGQNVLKSLQQVKRITARPSQELMERLNEIQGLQKSFGNYLLEKPYVFQKMTLPSLLLARELLSKARDEINLNTIDDLAKEIANRQKTIDEFLGRSLPNNKD